MPREWFLVNRSMLEQMSAKQIFTELTNHLELSSKKPKFPDVFWISIDLETDDDTNGLQYHSEKDKEPFLSMGYSDIGFFTTVALMRLASKNTV